MRDVGSAPIRADGDPMGVCAYLWGIFPLGEVDRRCYNGSGLHHDELGASSDLVACVAEQARYHPILRGGDLLLHLHGFENEQGGTGLDLLTGPHEDADNLPGHGRAQVPRASGRRPAPLAGVKEVIFSSRPLQGDFSGVFDEGHLVDKPLSQLEDVLAHRDVIDPRALRLGHNLDLNRLLVGRAAPIGKIHGLPPRRHPSERRQGVGKAGPGVTGAGVPGMPVSGLWRCSNSPSAARASTSSDTVAAGCQVAKCRARKAVSVSPAANAADIITSSKNWRLVVTPRIV